MIKLKIILGLIFLFSYLRIGIESTRDRGEIPDYFCIFMDSYENLRSYEGNYSYLEDDPGGETYAGIARNFHQNWEGWRLLDDFKKDSVILWNKRIDAMEQYVITFYYDTWYNEGYYNIKDRPLREYLFDYHNTGVIAYQHVKEVLYEMGNDVCVGTELNEEVIDALNRVNSEKFLTRLQLRRILFYERVAFRHPELQKYLQGWRNRANRGEA